MHNRLKKQLAQIKARAGLSRTLPVRAGEDTEKNDNAVVDAIVKTGAVQRGDTFDRLRTLRRRLPWRNQKQSATGTPDIQSDPLDMFRVGSPQPLEKVVKGDVRSCEGSSYFLVRPVGADVDRDAPVEARCFARLNNWPEQVDVTTAGGFRRARTPGQKQLPRILFDAREVLFLDIETTGLSANNYLFLIGLMFLENGEFVVEQVLARDYGEETGVLKYVREVINRYNCVVTYNGASFDLPYIRTRWAVHRIPGPRAFGSVDLLHTAREVFAEILPDRRLVTVERHLRGFDRKDDIPSRYIPQAYHDFVRTGDARAMANILYHNRMDLFAMAVMVNRLSEREL